MKQAMRWIVIAGTLLNVILGVCTVVAGESGTLADNPVRFAILGDRTGDHVGDVYDRIVNEIERLKPEFVMTVGDMIEGYANDTAVYNDEWREYLKIVEPLTMPIHFTPGNHDITNDVAVEPYSKFIGEPYHSFDYRGIHITVIDNSRWPRASELPPEQLAWVEADLKLNQHARWTMVFFHQPCWYNTVSQGEFDTLHTLFRVYGVDAVFSGHFHQYFSSEYDGIKYTAVGSSGGGVGSDTAYLGFHYAWVTADDDSIYINPVRAGSVLPWDHHTVAEMYQRELVRRQTIRQSEPVAIDGRAEGKKVEHSLVILNSGPATIEDTLRWADVGGWTIEPLATPLSVEPGDSARVTFALTVPAFDGLFPAPELSLSAPYMGDRTTTISAQLQVARTVTCLPLESSLDTRVEELVAGDGSDESVEDTWFRFLWDDSALYLLAGCTESSRDSMVTRSENQDDAVYADDCVGFFIHPDPTQDKAYQLYFNADGVCFDQLLSPAADGYWNGDRSWSSGAVAEVSSDEESWSITVPVSWTSLGVPGPPPAGSWIGINFRRKQHGGERIGNFQVPIDYDPNTFGRMYFK